MRILGPRFAGSPVLAIGLMCAALASPSLAQAPRLPLRVGETQSPTWVQVKNLYRCEDREVGLELLGQDGKVELSRYTIDGRAISEDQRVRINLRLAALGRLGDVSLSCGKGFELISIGGDSSRGPHSPARVNLRVVGGHLAE